MRRLLPAVLAVLLAAGCGGGEDAGELLRTTADRLGEVRSGTLEVRVLATPKDRPDGVGFELSGPFSFAEDAPLPDLRIRFSRLLGEGRTTATLTSTGDRAWVTTEGRTVELGDEATQRLAQPAGGGGKAGGGRSLADLGVEVERWIEDPSVSDGPTVDGAETDQIEGRLRTGTAVRDVLGALRRAGVEAPEVGKGLIERIDGLVSSSRAVVVTGREDRLLRRLELEADLRPAEELDAAVPGAGAVRLRASLVLRRPNEPVRVDPPR